MTCVYVRKATGKDFPEMKKIFDGGHGFLKERGIN